MGSKRGASRARGVEAASEAHDKREKTGHTKKGGRRGGGGKKNQKGSKRAPKFWSISDWRRARLLGPKMRAPTAVSRSVKPQRVCCLGVLWAAETTGIDVSQRVDSMGPTTRDAATQRPPSPPSPLPFHPKNVCVFQSEFSKKRSPKFSKTRFSGRARSARPLKKIYRVGRDLRRSKPRSEFLSGAYVKNIFFCALFFLSFFQN